MISNLFQQDGRHEGLVDPPESSSERSFRKDVEFLRAWEEGKVRSLSGTLRARQIKRAAVIGQRSDPVPLDRIFLHDVRYGK